MADKTEEAYELDLLKELLEKHKDKIYLNMPDDSISRTQLDSVKRYNDSILLHSRGYNLNHDE